MDRRCVYYKKPLLESGTLGTMGNTQVNGLNGPEWKTLRAFSDCCSGNNWVLRIFSRSARKVYSNLHFEKLSERNRALLTGTLALYRQLCILFKQYMNIFSRNIFIKRHTSAVVLKMRRRTYWAPLYLYVQWARDDFEGNFTGQAGSALQYLKDPAGFIEKTRKLPGNEPLTTAQGVVDFLVKDKPKDFAECIGWARRLFEERYVNQIKQLLHNFPPDQKTSSGRPRKEVTIRDHFLI